MTDLRPVREGLCYNRDTGKLWSWRGARCSGCRRWCCVDFAQESRSIEELRQAGYLACALPDYELDAGLCPICRAAKDSEKFLDFAIDSYQSADIMGA